MAKQGNSEKQKQKLYKLKLNSTIKQDLRSNLNQENSKKCKRLILKNYLILWWILLWKNKTNKILNKFHFQEILHIFPLMKIKPWKKVHQSKNKIAQSWKNRKKQLKSNLWSRLKNNNKSLSRFSSKKSLKNITMMILRSTKKNLKAKNRKNNRIFLHISRMR